MDKTGSYIMNKPKEKKLNKQTTEPSYMRGPNPQVYGMALFEKQRLQKQSDVHSHRP
jgi:hypothetical protein